eukprot:TRINITY_DN74098_c0_g1_i1.p1 TRINITY_DN74098_c0_g1~~TRINITY_DN74098_c0_g1_i1.p1  ORF type:complete len:762 (-),score=232.80 TRINITY_DN74098_c0_g1_i1:87-2372(-)
MANPPTSSSWFGQAVAAPWPSTVGPASSYESSLAFVPRQGVPASPRGLLDRQQQRRRELGPMRASFENAEAAVGAVGPQAEDASGTSTSSRSSGSMRAATAALASSVSGTAVMQASVAAVLAVSSVRAMKRRARRSSTKAGGWGFSRSSRGCKSVAVRRRAAEQEMAVEEAEESDAGPPVEEKEVLYFGGVASAQDDKIEDTEQMRVASRINQALAMRRQPQKIVSTDDFAETAWYEELGCDPTATQEQLRLAYLTKAEDVEERLTYLLDSGVGTTPIDDEDDIAEDEEDEDGQPTTIDDARDDSEMITLLPDAGSLANALGEGEGALSEAESEAEQVSLEFMRMSNLYQILSAPRLRQIYNEEGVEGLAMRVPMLHKGLLEPERVLRMARGLREPTDVKPSLLLRQMPRQKTFARYQAKNSIRQVLRRLTDVFRVWTFQNSKQLAYREKTIYTELPEVAVFGRVNSGKSSLIQHLLSAGKMKHQRLATPSQWPGKTKGINVYCVNRRFTLADTAGYGAANVDNDSAKEVYENWKEKYEPLTDEYLEKTPWLRAAVYVHDIAKDVKNADIKMVKMLKKHKIPVLLVFTKDDKVDSDPHRLSRVARIRRKLMWPMNWPHTFYCTRRGGYGQVFKNMFGTMLLSLVSSADREESMKALKDDCSRIFWDYRDKYVPRPRTQWGKIPKEKKSREYPNEDIVYTDEDLAEEEEAARNSELRALRKAKERSGKEWTVNDMVEQEIGTAAMTPRERRRRWAEMLEAAP